MQMKIKCPNGHVLSAKPELAGHTLKCPKCGVPTLVVTPQVEVVEVTEQAEFRLDFSAVENDAFRSLLPEQAVQPCVPLAAAPSGSAAESYWQPKSMPEASPAASSTPKRRKKTKAIELTGGLLFVSLVAMFGGVCSILIAMLLFITNAFLAEEFKTIYLHERAGFLLIASQLLISGVCLMAGGIGILAKEAWGWMLVTIYWVYCATERLLTLGLLLLAGLPTISMGTRLLVAFFSASFAIYMLSDETRDVFDMPKKMPLVAGGVGVFYALIVLAITASTVGY